MSTFDRVSRSGTRRQPSMRMAVFRAASDGAAEAADPARKRDAPGFEPGARLTERTAADDVVATAATATAANNAYRAVRRRGETCFTESESVTERDLVDVVQTGVLGLRDAAEIETEAAPARAEPVGDAADLPLGIRVPAHARGELVRVPQLESVVVGAERVGDERLIEVLDK